MAVPTGTEAEKLKKEYQQQYEEAKKYGDYAQAAEIEKMYLDAKASLDRQVGLAATAPLVNPHIGFDTIYDNTIYDNTVSSSPYIVTAGTNTGRYQAGPQPPATDVLLLRGKELSPDWRGAEITNVHREALGAYTFWLLRFQSKWSSEEVHLYLSMNDVSGSEADKIGETYKEVLNQRRIG